LLRKCWAPSPFFLTSRQDKRLSPLHRTGMLLGISEDETWEKEIITISPGDGLLLYTDGITEGFNEDGVLYGQNRLKKVMGDLFDSSADTICSTVLLNLDNFVGAEDQSDDIAMIVIKRENRSNSSIYGH